MELFHNYFHDPVLDGAFIYEGNIPFQYNVQEGMYKEFSGNPTGNIFLATSRDHEYLLHHKGNTSHISNHSLKSTKSEAWITSVENTAQISGKDIL